MSGQHIESSWLNELGYYTYSRQKRMRDSSNDVTALVGSLAPCHATYQSGSQE